METLYLLIPLSVLLVAGVAAVLIWAIRAGQYDDLDRAGHQVLLDDEEEAQERPRSHNPEE